MCLSTRISWICSADSQLTDCLPRIISGQKYLNKNKNLITNFESNTFWHWLSRSAMILFYELFSFSTITSFAHTWHLEINVIDIGPQAVPTFIRNHFRGISIWFLEHYHFQRQYKVRVSGKMQLLQKIFEGNSPTQNKLTGQKQLLKRKEAALVTLWWAECQTL